MTNSNDPDEQTIRKEIIRRIFEQEKRQKDQRTQSAYDEATAAIGEQFSDLPPEEIDRIIREVRSEYADSAKRRGQRSWAWVAAGMATAVLVAAGVFFILRSSPVDEVSPTGSAPPAPSPNAVRNSPPPAVHYDKSAEKPSIRGIPVEISIGEDGFRPIRMTVAASWNRSTPLFAEPPEAIRREPAYRGEAQRYGHLMLGTGDYRRFDFVFDLVSGPNPVLYFDLNQNGDLTDDGGPIRNQGSGIFAAAIDIPFDRIMPQLSFEEPLTIWFFTNDSLWAKGRVAHYCRTQLKGQVVIDGRRYTAYIADSGVNDADFTNDGIQIDLDGDGEIDRKTERFRPGRPAVIDGTAYRFHIDL